MERLIGHGKRRIQPSKTLPKFSLFTPAFLYFGKPQCGRFFRIYSPCAPFPDRSGAPV
jgi:hypothetical protein